jgi:hypothetical protein
VEIAGNIKYKIDKILAVRKRWNQLEYRVKWQDYKKEDLEWYPLLNLKGALHKFKTFYLSYPQLPGPPLRLEEWIKAWEDGLDEYKYLNNNQPITGPLRTAFFQKRG